MSNSHLFHHCDHLDISLTFSSTCLIIALLIMLQFNDCCMNCFIDILIYECHPAEEQTVIPINFTDPREFYLSCVVVFVMFGEPEFSSYRYYYIIRTCSKSPRGWSTSLPKSTSTIIIRLSTFQTILCKVQNISCWISGSIYCQTISHESLNGWKKKYSKLKERRVLEASSVCLPE